MLHRKFRNWETLFIMNMRALLKWLGIIPLLFAYLFTSGIISLLPVKKKIKRGVAIRNASFFSRLMLALLGVRVHVKHRERLRKDSSARLIIANHVSYVDVLVLSSLVPSVFITSMELKHTAMLGVLAQFAGSLYVERRKASGLKKEIEAIAEVLGQGFVVVLFPEGTTSNGDWVMPFKNSLFDTAVATRADILPICLRYRRVDDEPLTPQNRDAVFYYGGTTFSVHLPKLLSKKFVDVEVLPLKTIKGHAEYSRKDLASIAHRQISDAYRA
jgi:lyso-ornithine lipid O-acyltransferase